jgi:hypothetical protein
MNIKHFKVVARVQYSGLDGFYFIRRRIYRNRNIMGIHIWFPVEVKDFGPFDSYLSAFALVQEKGGEVYAF